MKDIKILKNAVIVNFGGFTIKLKGKLEFIDNNHIQTREGNGYHTIYIKDDMSFIYDEMPFSLKS